MVEVGGYCIVDALGLNIGSASSTVSGLHSNLAEAHKTGKEVILHNCFSGAKKLSPFSVALYPSGTSYILMFNATTVTVTSANAITVADNIAKEIGDAFTGGTGAVYTGDCDNLPAGIQYVSNVAAHTPDDTNYTIIITIPTSTEQNAGKVQIAINRLASPTVWVRNRVISTGWGDWIQLAVTSI